MSLSSVEAGAAVASQLGRRPRVLMYTDDPQHGGVAQYNHAVLLELVRRGYEVVCAQTASTSPLTAIQREVGVRHAWIPYDTGKEFARSLADMETARALFTAERPDLVVFSDCCPLSNLGARQAALALRLPYVVVVGFVAPYLAERFAKFLPPLRQQYLHARAVVAVSQENLQLLRTRFGLESNRGQVIHYGRPETFFAPIEPTRRQQLRAECGLPASAVVALTTARLSGVKGWAYQFAAIDALRQARALGNLHFVWLGDGEMRPAIEQEIAKRGLQDRIKLPGHRWDVAAWYDIADAYVLPSEAEGMPLAIMEAMAKGLPVAATAVSGIPEQLGPTGHLLPDPTRDPRRTAEALTLILQTWSADGRRRRQAGEACRRRAQELFREELMLTRTVSLLESHLPAAVRAASLPSVSIP